MKESKHKMKLYHGTNYSSAINIVNHGIDLKYSKPYLDFGPGFYTTPSYDHAALAALRTTQKYNAKNATMVIVGGGTMKQNGKKKKKDMRRQ